jgi:hypothetical protein
MSRDLNPREPAKGHPKMAHHARGKWQNSKQWLPISRRDSNGTIVLPPNGGFSSNESARETNVEELSPFWNVSREREL